jgi:hypothetical protein
MFPLLSIVVWTTAAANGLLLLLSPIKYRAIIARLSEITEQSLVERPHKPEIEARFAGFIITLLTGCVLLSIIHYRLQHAELQKIDAQKNYTNAPWLGPAMTLFLFAGGIYTLLHPETIADWSARQFPEHVIAEETLLRWQMAARLLGAAAIVASGATIYFWTSAPS